VLFLLHRQPVSLNCRYHRKMLCLHGGSFPYSLLYARCTAITDKHLAYSNTQKLFSCFVAFCKGTELVLPTGAHNTNLVSLRFFLYINHICTCNTLENIAF
jgi:hypothetical protein